MWNMESRKAGNLECAAGAMSPRDAESACFHFTGFHVKVLTKPIRYGENPMEKADELLQRITYNPGIFGGKPIIRDRRLAVEHILGMLAAGDDIDTILEGIHGWSDRMSWHVWHMPIDLNDPKNP
jgi:hypothetical protein